MVSFSCEKCGDVLTKKKLDPHRARCRGATFTCIDCMVYFPGFEYRTHTSCMTEEQKYQGALYKQKKPKGRQNNIPPPAPAPPTQDDDTFNFNTTINTANMVPTQAYVEDAPEDVNALPEAPSPPPAVPDQPSVNVFDFLVGNTPVASVVGFPKDEGQLVRYDYDNEAYVDPDGYMVDDDNDALVQYGDGPIPAAEAMSASKPKPEPKKTESKKSEPTTKDKKRKRLHVEINDQVMTDAPPGLHTGLTNSLSHMQFPPSPEFSGGEGAASPDTKKSKHSRSKSSSKSKHGRHQSESLGSSLLAMMGGSRSKKREVSKKRSSTGSSSSPSSSSKRRSSEDKEKSEKPKLLEYKTGSRPSSREGSDNNQMVLYQPRADLFLSMVTKGPESERGCSVNKALKRFHRERTEARDKRGGASRAIDEKELFRSLRMRRNDRGEIVLFSLEGDL